MTSFPDYFDSSLPKFHSISLLSEIRKLFPFANIYLFRKMNQIVFGKLSNFVCPSSKYMYTLRRANTHKKESQILNSLKFFLCAFRHKCQHQQYEPTWDHGWYTRVKCVTRNVHKIKANLTLTKFLVKEKRKWIFNIS